MALRLLTRREHSRLELARKLRDRAFSEQIVGAVLDDLEAQGLLSDRRFAEQYLEARVRRGFGPLRIRAELSKRGVDAALVSQVFESTDVDWLARVREAMTSRYGADAPLDLAEAARRARFLDYRGFPSELVKAVLRSE
ncbi:MAG: regulatory protein RecX [Pseudomonadota bacterium]